MRLVYLVDHWPGLFEAYLKWAFKESPAVIADWSE
jgi:hypothetical protein